MLLFAHCNGLFSVCLSARSIPQIELDNHCLLQTLCILQMYACIPDMIAELGIKRKEMVFFGAGGGVEP